MKRLLAIFLLLVFSAHANWEELIHPCDGKRANHSLAGIDFIYLINLKQRPEKWQSCLQELEPYGIYPYRFDAINGWELDPKTFENLGCPDLYPGMPPGKIACVLSHLSVLWDAYLSGYETIWVMEDDIEVIQSPLQIPSLIQELDELVEDWDILYSDIDTKDFYGNRVACKAIFPRPNLTPRPLAFYLRCFVLNETFSEIGMRYGCYSMILRRSGIKKILDYFTKYRLFLPIDMELFFVPGLKQITLSKDVVSTKPGIFSDTTFPLTSKQ